MQRLLLIEDEEVIVKALRRLLERNHYEVHTATTVEEAIGKQPQSFDLILADLRLPGAEGTSIIAVAEQVPVVIMTSHASVRSAVEAMRYGAIDYIAKPFDHDELLMVIDRALKQNLLQAQNRALRLDVQRMLPVERAVTGSLLKSMLDFLAEKKDSKRFLHLYGEPGTEREGLARALHARSERSEAPFVVADIGVESAARDANTLLGGSGDSHSQDNPPKGFPPGGLLQAAQNGTLVIRHPENLQPAVQQLLGDMLGQGVMRTPEHGHQRAINIRVITLSHVCIETLQSNGQLQPSLAQLLVDEQCQLPPLRERPDDILPLAQQQLRSLQHRHGRKPLSLGADAIAALRASDWAGNVAELDGVLTRAFFTARSSVIGKEDLGIGHSEAGTRDFSLDEYFRYFVLLHQNALSETDLAARLGISRKALWERRQKMALQRDANQDLSSSRSIRLKPHKNN